MPGSGCSTPIARAELLRAHSHFHTDISARILTVCRRGSSNPEDLLADPPAIVRGTMSRPHHARKRNQIPPEEGCNTSFSCLRQQSDNREWQPNGIRIGKHARPAWLERIRSGPDLACAPAPCAHRIVRSLAFACRLCHASDPASAPWRPLPRRTAWRQPS